MRKTAVLFSTLLLSISSNGQTTHDEFNLGFEQIHSQGGLPDKWFQWGSGYKITIDTTTKHSGRASVVIEPITATASNSFGCIAYAIPSRYEAREVELRAYMKLEDITDGPVGLLIRIDGSTGTLGFDNMQSKNIQGSMDWTLFSVKIPFPKNAKTIFIGAIHSGNGRLWVDDFEVLLDGRDIGEARTVETKEYKADTDKEFDMGSKLSSFVLTNSRMEDLDVLGKLWGFLKYYHPSIALGEYNWDYELFRILPKVLDASNKSERNAILTSWVMGLGNFETVQRDTSRNEEVTLTPDLSWIHEETLGRELVTSLDKVKAARRPTDHYYIGKIAGVGNPEFTNEQSYASLIYPDPGFRLLCLYRYWNMIAYYFPYRNLIEEDWDSVLVEYIPKFVSAGSELEYKSCVLSLIARTHDTHAIIWDTKNTFNEYRGRRFAPLEISFVENQAIVTGYLDNTKGEKTGVRVGDAIEAVDGKTVGEIVRERLPLTPASNYPTKLRDIARNLLRTNDSSLDITYWNGERKVSARVETFHPSELDYFRGNQRRDSCFTMITSDIAYLYPGSIKNEYIAEIMKKVLKTRGLIIDFRCYPSDFIVFSLGTYLLPDSKSFVKFSTGSIESPGLFTLTKELAVGRSNPDYYKGKIVILVNETTQSQAEYTTMAFRTAPKAKVIGSTTAGADGNVSKIALPGGIYTMMTGIGVYYPDGTETQRIGIVPDLAITRTIRGIKEKRDELLEMAIQVINGD